MLDRTGPYSNNEYVRNSGPWYARQLTALRENAGCVGAHLCGAYLRNRDRKRGLLDEEGNPGTEDLAVIRQANDEAASPIGVRPLLAGVKGVSRTCAPSDRTSK